MSNETQYWILMHLKEVSWPRVSIMWESITAAKGPHGIICLSWSCSPWMLIIIMIRVYSVEVLSFQRALWINHKLMRSLSRQSLKFLLREHRSIKRSYSTSGMTNLRSQRSMRGRKSRGVLMARTPRLSEALGGALP